MNLSQTFILRPVATTLFMTAIFLAGIVGYLQLPISALPEVDYPTIQVATFYPGASPEVMVSSVTAPLERQLGQVPGLQQMTSTSSDGSSIITLQFNLSLDIDVAAEQVQQSINAATSYLPTDLPNPPVYSKTNPADSPILTLALTSTTLPLSKIEDLADTRLAQKISQISGVGLVSINGGQKPAVRIRANPLALASYGLSMEDIRTTISNADLNQAKGSFDGPMRAVQIDANDQLLSSKEYAALIIAYRNGAPIRMSDVAQCLDDTENNTQAAWMAIAPATTSQQAIIMNIQRQPGANIISVVDNIQKLLPKLRQTLPATVDLKVLSDRTTTIRASVRDVQYELLLTIGLVVAVIFIFLRSFIATIIPSVAVPLSLVGTFGVMYLLGFSLNNLTLMALTISTGFVVDDAIVMIENIVRYIEDGETPLQAALKGAGQIGFTILSLTVSLIAVLIPLLFMGDIVGRLFREFAITLSVTILISAVVSLTLTPMMCAWLLRSKTQQKPGWFFQKSEAVFDAIIDGYGWLLRGVLQVRGLTLLVALGTLALTFYLYIQTPKGLFPTQDTGVIQGISEADQSISFPAMAERQQALAQVILRDPAVASLSSFIGVDGTNVTLNSGRIQINLKPLEERRVGAQEIIRRLQSALAPVQGITLFMQPVQDLTIDAQTSRTQYQYTVEDANADELNQWTPKLLAKFQSLPELQDVASDQQTNGLRVTVNLNRDTASRFGLNMLAIDNVLYDAYGQRQVATLFTEVNQYHVILEVDPAFQDHTLDLQHLYITPGSGSSTSSSSSTGSTSTVTASPSTTTLTTAASTTALTTTSSAASSIDASSAASLTAAPSASAGSVPLGTLATWSTGSGPLSINHLGQFPLSTLSFNLAPGVSLSQAVTAIDAAKTELNPPISLQTQYQGATQAFQASLTSEPLLILAALITVYIVLGMLYESFIHPITILSTLPSAGLGALLALNLFHNDLNIISLIGIILLIGIVQKNAIMMVDFALSAEREHGFESVDAIYQACLLRFRPIVMTTLAAMLGGIPLALGGGVGAELRQPLGIAIVGGLIVSQVLTLFTTPVIYLAFSSLGHWLFPPKPSATVAENGEGLLHHEPETYPGEVA